MAAALPATAQPRPPAAPWTPWSVESPGPLGARFGLGLDLALDRLDDAAVVGGTQTVTAIGPEGSRETTVAPLDVELTNRKQGQDWEERSLGFQAPVALPPFHLGGLRVEPSLVLEAAAVEGELTVVDLVERTPDRALDGTAARWGVGVEALGELCRGCRWFWSAGYRYRSLAGLDLGAETQGERGGPTVTQSAEIDHDGHHLTARLGALFAGGRATAYVGVRDRRGDLEVTDETTVTSPQGIPDTTVLTRLDLDADDTAALAGTDFRLGRGYVGRVEATFGGDGESVLLKVVRAHHWRGPPRPGAPGRWERPEEEEPEEVEARRQRAADIADALAPEVTALHERFAGKVAELERKTGPGRPLPTGATLALLDELEGDLRATLDEPELRPTLAWFLDLLERARTDLAGPPPAAGPAARRTPRPPVPLGLAFAALPAPQEPGRANATPTADGARGWLATFRDALADLVGRADTRRLTEDLCILSVPRPGVFIELWPKGLPDPRTVDPDTARDLDFYERWTDGRLSVFYRGLYAYRAIGGRQRTVACPADGCPPLDLWKQNGPLLVCELHREPRRCFLAGGDPSRCRR